MGQRVICHEAMREHVLKVLSGEYDIPELRLEAPVILDIGANVGSFSVWAEQRWPNAVILAYEPNPESFELLKQNCPKVEKFQVAVSTEEGEAFLYNGKTNQGECSLIPGRSDTGQFVPTLSPSLLPPCDIMKIDTEGSELPILCGYDHLDKVQAVMLEWHSAADRYRIGVRMMEAGFNLVSDAAWAIDAGVMKWARLSDFETRLYHTAEAACQKS